MSVLDWARLMTQPSAKSAPGRKTTLADLFKQIENLESDCVHYYDGFRTWKRRYDEVALAARKFAADLAANGIGKGEKVIFWCENRPEWLAALWGCLISGVIAVPLDFRSSADFVMRVQRITNARLILTGEETSGAPSFAGCPVWRLDEFEWPEEGTARVIPPAPPVSIQPDDIAEIVFTSGSTGEPKGVVLTHRNILSSIIGVEPAINRYRRYIQYAEPIRVLNLLPLSHMFGQSLAAFGPPLVPACVVFMKSYSPPEIIRRIREEKILAAVVVPKMLESLMEYVASRFTAKGDRLSRLRRVWRHRKLHWAFGLKFWAFIVGGAALDTEVEDFWARRGFFVIQGYGLTETAPIISFNDPSSAKRGSVGRTLPGVEVKIAPDGEILVRGENVTAGYFGSPEETQRAFTDGWFHTGDFGELDSTGHLTIHGRKKELIVTPEGLNVVPEDVEHVLDSIPGVRESAVVGPDRVRAVLVLEPGANLDEIVREANQKLEPRQRIRDAAIWPGPLLPRTEATGKLKRFAVLDWLEHGQAKAPGEGVPATVPGRNPLYDLLAKYAPGRKITEETTLDELGLSSLDRVELMIDVEKTLGTQIDESSFAAHRTAGELLSAPKPVEEVKFPEWADSPILRIARAVAQPAVLLPLTRVFADLEVSGREHLPESSGPLILAANHQSHMDTPVILAALPARRRNKVAVAMWKEYFAAHFHPERFPLSERWSTTLLYVLACGAFHGFPLPQTEMETSQALRYMGRLVNRGESILIFPEGGRSESGEIRRFLPGVGMLASRLHLPVVPVRLRGLNYVLPPSARFPRRGSVQVRFGKPLELKGRNYAELAREVEESVRAL
jgi:long-chain acyl-CoA synthetase